MISAFFFYADVEHISNDERSGYAPSSLLLLLHQLASCHRTCISHRCSTFMNEYSSIELAQFTFTRVDRSLLPTINGLFHPSLPPGPFSCSCVLSLSLSLSSLAYRFLTSSERRACNVILSLAPLAPLVFFCSQKFRGSELFTLKEKKKFQFSLKPMLIKGNLGNEHAANSTVFKKKSWR